jgi:hypothetical protein
VEKTNYQETSRYSDVVEFCQNLAKVSPKVRLTELGTSQEGRKLPVMIIADPPVATPEEAAKSGKLIIFAWGNIHAGEVDGKEALQILAREIATTKEHPLLKDLILVFAPIFNADGNERFDKHRPEQGGPTLVGIRANAQELDLNRDFVKLESPEVKALVRFVNLWDPAVCIDMHTTNGSYHKYTLTYEGGSSPAGDKRLVDLTRDRLFPEVGRRMEKTTGYKTFFYGNFAKGNTIWDSVPPTPRYGFHYFGICNKISILSESYSYASFKDRTLSGKSFVQTISEYIQEHKDEVKKLLAEARETTIKAGLSSDGQPGVVLQTKPVPYGRPYKVLGEVVELKDGKRHPTGKAVEYEVLYMGGSEPTKTVTRPRGYIIPASQTRVLENLKNHGIEMEKLAEAGEYEIEAYRVDKITKSRTFEKHQPVTIKVTPRTEKRKIEAGDYLVKTSQKLGSLAAYILEPESADGLATWNFFDSSMEEGKDFPVLRLPPSKK